MDKLREEFFKKHVSHKTTDGIPVVSTHPHNLFEWFKENMLPQTTTTLCICNIPEPEIREVNNISVDFCTKCDKEI